MTAPSTTAGAREQTRARYPDEEGYVERDGVRVFWESYGQGEQTILFLPTWTLVHSRVWKAQIPYFARHFGFELVGVIVDSVGQERTRLYALGLNATHDAEHYGNIVTYLRINGIVPPSSRRHIPTPTQRSTA